MQRYFSHKQAIKIAGIPKPTLDRWLREKVVTPIKSGDTPTSPLIYTPMQVFGLHMAWMFGQYLGIPVKTSGYICQFFERYTLRKVRGEFAEGRKYLLLDPVGRIELVRIPDDKEIRLWMVNCERQLDRVVKKMEEIELPRRYAALLK